MCTDFTSRMGENIKLQDFTNDHLPKDLQKEEEKYYLDSNNKLIIDTTNIIDPVDFSQDAHFLKLGKIPESSPNTTARK